MREATRAGFEVRAIPGPSAITTALAAAGLPAERFCFEGFLPAKSGERRAALVILAHEPRTLVFFEAPHRILATLTDLAAEFGANRQAVVARELTKIHESFYRGTLSELIAYAPTDENFARGEITLVVHGAPPASTQSGDAHELRRTVDLLLKELPPGRAAALAAQLTGRRVPRPMPHPPQGRWRPPSLNPGLEGVTRRDPIDFGARARIVHSLESAGQSLLSGKTGGGGKSGLRRIRCQVTPGGREPTESATESRPPKSLTGPARVKRCGKSAPRRW